MDELAGLIIAPIAAVFGLIFWTIFLPFVLLGQIIFDLSRPADKRRGLSLQRRSVFQHFRDSLIEGVVVYGIAVIAFVAVFAGLVVGAGLMQNTAPPAVVEEPDSLLERAVTAGGKAALAEAEERGWLDRFRGADEEGAAPAEPEESEQETTEKKPFWKVWE